VPVVGAADEPFLECCSGLAGSVEQIIERVHQWGRTGIDYITLPAPRSDEGSKRMLAEKV
jgi:hypothetical protein